MRPKICVLGAGVAGLSCAFELAESGYKVTVVTAVPIEETTSAIAAAIWYPFLAAPKDRTKNWALRSFLRFAELAYTPATGVRMVKLDEVGKARLAYPEWADSSYHIQALAAPHCPPGYVSGWRTLVPLVEIPIYLPWLKAQLELRQVEIVQKRVSALDELAADGDIIINCCGLGARELCNDTEMTPIRGQILRVIGSGLTRHIANDDSAAIPLYALPRSNDCILGGSVTPDCEDLEPDADETERILAGIHTLLPQASIERVLQVKVGLRPGRTEVRLEADETAGGIPIIHNYGHGGSGITLSWGCAEEVESQVDQLIKA